MKKVYIALLSATLALVCATILAACERHTFDTEWTWDDVYHWHQALCEHTDQVSDKAQHTLDADGNCTVCGYRKPTVTPHFHEFSSQWTTDSGAHWHKCTGCQERSDYAEHTFGPDGKCTVCGYEKTVYPHTHTFGADWLGDETSHWHECTLCGERSDEQQHTRVAIPAVPATCDHTGLTEGARCSVCLRVLQEQQPTDKLAHDYDLTTWYSNADGHWHKCNNCSAITAYSAHDNAADCSICGYKNLGTQVTAAEWSAAFDALNDIRNFTYKADNAVEQYTQLQKFTPDATYFDDVSSGGVDGDYFSRNYIVRQGSGLTYYYMSKYTDGKWQTGDGYDFTSHRTLDEHCRFALTLLLPYVTDAQRLYVAANYDSASGCYTINTSDSVYTVRFDANKQIEYIKRVQTVNGLSIVQEFTDIGTTVVQLDLGDYSVEPK